MNIYGKSVMPSRFFIPKESRSRMGTILKTWMGDGRAVDITFKCKAQIKGLENGEIIFNPVEMGEMYLETWYKKRTITQLKTLKALESLLYWANHGHYPLRSEHLYGYHQVILEAAGIRKVDPESGSTVLVTTSCPLCTTDDMNKFIDIAVEFILEADVPPNLVEPVTEKNFVDLFTEWYRTRSLSSDLDHLSWEEYCRVFPYDEFTCTYVPEKGTGQTQKVHIVSRGAAADAIDESWNWFRGSTAVHQRIHSEGWGPVLKEFPHILPKVIRARELAGKLEKEYESSAGM